MIFGIDPGSVSAAYGIIGDDGTFFATGDIAVVDRMVDAAEFSRLIRHWMPDEAIIELVSSMPKQGIASAFRFGMGVGLLRGVLAANEVPLHQVPPGKWKKHFSLDSDGEKSRALALRYWPECKDLTRKRDHGRAEALLLARYHKETRHADA